MALMRILAVTNMYPTAEAPAAGIFVEQQIEGLRRVGVIPEILFLDRRTEGRHVYRGLRSRLRRVLDASPADLVHVMYGGVMAERATRACGDRPVVVTYHGSDLQGSLGAGPLERLSAAYGVWCSRRAALRARGVVLVAAHLARRLPGELPPERVRVIPCGIDLERFRPQDADMCRRQLGWHPDRFHVLFATNNDHPVKRPELARDAIRRLEANGCPADLHVLRGVPNGEVPVWLNAADVLLLTSYQEGSPTIVKEAMACERPIVSVRVGDVATQLDGIEGCHLAQDDPESLAAALLSVYRGPRTVSTRARAAAQSLELTARRLVDFYEWILRAQAGRDRQVIRTSVRTPAGSASGTP
jgi:glycosyltransferase involved in cell wall biosynthesis